MKTVVRNLLAWGLVILCSPLFGNYLRVQNITTDLTNGTVSFDLAWNNSWRLDSLGAPFHWDAAWVFVKWRDCNALPNTDWTHGLISTTLTDHTFGNLEPTLADGSAVGIDAGPENTGVMLRRDVNGIFAAAGFTSLTLDITNLPATGNYDVRVFGIEMVYVPQSQFILGGTVESSRFNSGGFPLIIDSEAGITLEGGTTTTLPAAYPKGYDAFYCMKYEISQGQYSEFLNTLSASNQFQFYPNNFNSYRHRISGGGTPPDIYYSDRPDRAVNYLHWNDVLAYLDWAALRPMTEMQYEKASRGNDPYIESAYAWGTQMITAANLLQTPEDGTELVQTANANASYGNTPLTGGDGGYGPLRVGIFATAATTTRQETGASYYGIMEMSGNVYEQCVSVHTNTEMINFDGQWGDGYLDATTGYADVPNWPYADCSGSIPCYTALRGGSYSDTDDRLRISDRTYYYYSITNNTSRRRNYGGRGIR